MKYVLEISIDNAAFEDCGIEISRVLRAATADLEDRSGRRPWRLNNLRDINGNRIGWHAVTTGHAEII